jgi:PKD domain
MKKIFFPLLSAVFAIIIFATCKKTEEAPADKPPVSKAGTDETIYVPTDSITLDGSASRDPDGNIIRYEWTKISGPDTFNILKPSAVRTKVMNLQSGTYKFQLKVTDSTGISALDTVQIRVAGPAPIAKVGADTSITLSSCADNSGSVELDGTGSSDPDNDIISTCWAQISGPTGNTILNRCLVKTKVAHLSPGEYAFQLEVTDAGGSVSRDTMLIHVKGMKEHDFDITLNSDYLFQDNYEDTWYGNYSYDLTTAAGTGNFLPFGDFNIDLQETADSATSSDVHSTYINIQDGEGNQVNGECSVNFKKLIGQGGGPFNGTYKVTSGSAQPCGDVFAGLAPLTVAGNLDRATHKITLRITGKVYF